jgi:hypothetical protein
MGGRANVEGDGPMNQFLRKYYKPLYLLSTGGVTLGILQGIEGINFANIWTTVLTQIFSALIAIFFGGSDAISSLLGA